MELDIESVLSRLSKSAKERADKSLESIFKKVEKNADSSENWPICVKEDMESIKNCQRTMNILLRQLQKNGLFLNEVENSFEIDTIDMETGDGGDINELEDIIEAAKAKEESSSRTRERLMEIMDFVAYRIKETIEEGRYRLDIDATEEPICSNPVMMKKLLVTLHGKGYTIKHNNKEVEFKSRPDYEKLKNISIYWLNPNEK